MNLNDVFGGDLDGEESSGEKAKTPWVKWDRKNPNQFVRFRFLEEFDELRSDARVTHSVENVAFNARCNLKPLADQKDKGLLFLWNGWSKGENKKPEFNCLFCEETKALKDEAVAKYGKDTPQGKAEAIKASRLHSRSQQLVANVEYEVWERKPGKKKPEVIQEASQALMGIRINDLFNKNGKGEYATLNNFFNTKGTITENWFTMTSDNKITPDDKIDSDCAEYSLFDKPKVMPYEEAVERHQARRGEAKKAVPLEEEFDSEIPF